MPLLTRSLQCLLVASWVCAPLNLSAADLREIYRSAVIHDAQFAAEQARHTAEFEQVAQRRAQLLPQLSLDAQNRWNDSEYESRSDASSVKQENLAYSLQLVQPLFRWQNWIRFQQGQQLELLAAGRLESARQTLLLRVAEAYFNALHASDVRLAVTQLNASEAEQLAIARKSFELGNVSIADVHEALASFDRTAAELVDAESNLQLAYYELTRIIGWQPEELVGFREGVVFSHPQPNSIDDWVTAARHGNLEVKIRELQLVVAQHEVKSRKAEHLPGLDMIASWSTQSNPSLGMEQSETTSVGMRLSMPLYAGGGTSAAVRNAAALEVQSEAELDDATRAAVMSVRQAWLGSIGGLARIRALEAAKVSAQSALESNRIGYRVGVRSGVDVLDVQSQYSETLQQLSRAKYDTVVSQLRLKAAVGSLSEHDLDAVNQLLDL
jgi:outer membrane protein